MFNQTVVIPRTEPLKAPFSQWQTRFANNVSSALDVHFWLLLISWMVLVWLNFCRRFINNTPSIIIIHHYIRRRHRWQPKHHHSDQINSRLRVDRPRSHSSRLKCRIFLIELCKLRRKPVRNYYRKHGSRYNNFQSQTTYLYVIAFNWEKKLELVRYTYIPTYTFVF